ncbi:THO complex subunit 3 [Spathaspora sp. JA1]|nr:THO complex subunit 3 [Spathaspora sp. JA1]
MSFSSNKDFFNRFIPIPVKDKPISGYTSSSTEIIEISINDCGTRLVASRTDKSLRIWKCLIDRLSDPVIIEDAHAKSVECISWDPKTEYSFATVGRDEYIKIWRGNTGVLERTIKVNNSNSSLKLVSYSYDGEILVAIDRESNVFVYSTSQNYKLVNEFKLSEYVYSIKWFNLNHKFFICALHDGTLPVYEISNDGTEVKLKATLTGHRSSATTVSISPRGNYFAVGASEGVVSIWDCSTMLNQRVLTDIDESIAHTDISRDGSFVAVSYDRGSNSIIYEIETGEQMFEIPNSISGQTTFSKVCWFPNKTAFVYSSDQGTTMVFMKKSDRIARKN